jgi:hypothetical protein
MQKIDETHYRVDRPAERISMDVSVDQRPYLATFEDPPKGSKWENVSKTPTSEHREFTAPTQFDASFNEALPSSATTDHVTYTITFRGQSGPAAGTAINVPKGQGPILETFVFQF